MGKQFNDYQKTLLEIKGLSKGTTDTMFLGIIAGYLAQILDILECAKWNYNLHDKPEKLEE